MLYRGFVLAGWFVGCGGLSDGFVYSLVAFGFGDFFE
jgi:hypothetical protein